MTMNVETLVKVSAAEQLQTLRDLQQINDEGFAELGQRPDFKALKEAKTIDAQMAAYDAITKETQAIWQGLSEKGRDIKDLRCYLYLHSPHAEVREETVHAIDQFIEENYHEDNIVGRVSEPRYYQDLLYLSTFGGKISRERPDVYHTAYEFNTLSVEGYQPAVPWNPMENLFEKGLTRAYAEDAPGNNLTIKGEAVLKRLTEKLGEPAAARRFTQSAAAPQQLRRNM